MNTIVKQAQPYWTKLTTIEYYSHLFFEGKKPLLPIYRYTKAITPKGQRRLVVERDFKEFQTEDEMVNYIEANPQIAEADSEAWEKYPYIPSLLQEWLDTPEASTSEKGLGV